MTRTFMTTSAVLAIVLAGGASARTTGQDPLHGWLTGSTAGLEQWTQGHLAAERKAVADLLAVKGARTVANTLEPFDRAQNELALAGDQTSLLYSVGDSAEIRDKGQALTQAVSSANTELSLNHDVYVALQALARTPGAKSADAATRHYLARTLLEYRLAGVDRDDATRAKVKALQDRMTDLSLQFGRNVQDGKLTIQAKADELTGLPADFVSRHPAAADGAIALTTDQPDVTPVLKFAANKDLRRRMSLAYTNRAYPKNEAVLRDLLQARKDLANLLGYATWADLATADQMIGSTARLKAFLAEVDAASRPDAKRETDALADFVRQKDASALPLTDADSGYWREQYRRGTYNFDSQSVRRFFPYEAVQAGILDAAGRFFHVSFKPVAGAKVWDAGVATFDVYDQGKKVGRIYLDMHPRDGKDKWFSSAPVTPGKAGTQLPEGVLICNFPGSQAGDPGLMEYGDVVTFFHEFGHLMHHVLGSQGRWSGEGGFNVEGDFVEAPSQMLEEMFHSPKVLQGFAKDYKTGEILPAATIARMNRADAYGRADWVQRQLTFSTYSLQIHQMDPAAIKFTALYQDDQRRFSPILPLEGANVFAAFTHLTGYSSNYYTYVLDKVIAVDFFEKFNAADPIDDPAALRYRRAVINRGATAPAAELVKGFLGRPQSVDALKRWIEVEFRK